MKKCRKWRQYLLLCWMSCFGGRWKSTCSTGFLLVVWTWIHVHMCRHTNTQSPWWAVLSLDLKWKEQHTNILSSDSLKLKTCELHWPLRGLLFSGGQIFTKTEKETAGEKKQTNLCRDNENIQTGGSSSHCTHTFVKNPDREMRSITGQSSVCLKALTWPQGQTLHSAEGRRVSSITSPPRNWDGHFLADTSSLLQMGQDIDSVLLLVGWRGMGGGDQNLN